MICGESCTTVTPESARARPDAARLSVTVTEPVLVWVGSETPAVMPLEVSSVMIEARLFTAIRSAE